MSNIREEKETPQDLQSLYDKYNEIDAKRTAAIGKYDAQLGKLAVKINKLEKFYNK